LELTTPPQVAVVPVIAVISDVTTIGRVTVDSFLQPVKYRTKKANERNIIEATFFDEVKNDFI
jgi:hypothetical protein